MPGLYDGDFIGYRVPSDAEVDDALAAAVVAIDANVLLNLYRFREQTASDLLKVLERLGDRLIVPHQALREFWRHRQRSPASPRAATATAEEALTRATSTLSRTLETWGKQVGLAADELTTLLARVEAFGAELQTNLGAVYGDTGARRPHDDPILAKLEELLAGRVTEPLSAEDWNECVAEARRRIEAEEPPGYRDRAKEGGETPEGGAGDYLVWYQATRHAAKADRDLVIVTADEKEDWWWRQRDTFLGPRPELTLEYFRLCGRRLYLLRPSDLLTRASALEVEVDVNSAADADRPAGARGTLESPRWSYHAYRRLIQDLGHRYPDQQSVILRASASGGFLPRQDVLELIGRSADGNLVRFALPAQNVADSLVDSGILEEGCLYPLQAMYEGPGKTTGYSVPEEFIEFEQRRREEMNALDEPQ
jgi:hypothetical protein